MSSEWVTHTMEEIAAPTPAAMATGPFGSSISAKYFVDSGVPVIRGSNLSPDTSTRLIEEGLVFITAEKAGEFDRSTARRGDLIFTCWGTINQVGLIDSRATFDRYVVSNKQMKLTVDPMKADPRFIYYVFSGPDKQAEILDNGIGSSVPGFNLGQLKRHEILLPSLTEQRAISDFLESLDDRITLLRETNATLEAIAQALFKSWFVDFDPVRAKRDGRAPEGMDEATAALFPDSFEHSELGEVPTGWDCKFVDDVAEIVKGKSYSSKDFVDSHHTALVTLKSFERGGGFRMDGFKPYAGAYKASQVVLAGDLIVAYTDVTQAAELIGRPAIVVGVPEYETLVASLDVGIVRPDPICSSRQFLYGLFKTDAFQLHAQSRTSGTTVLHLAKDGVGGFKFACPPPSVVSAFDALAATLSERRQMNSDLIRSLTALRDTLLPRLISGQLRLPEAAKAIEPALA